MDTEPHNLIFRSAIAALPEDMRKIFDAYPKLLGLVANYSDFFDDMGRPEDSKIAIDSQWQKYSIYPGSRTLHDWIWADGEDRTPILEYLLNQIISTYKQDNFSDFIKFSGCLCHFFGDTTQIAHLDHDVSMSFISQLLPRPVGERFQDFNYHTDIEAIAGECGNLRAPELLGSSIDEIVQCLIKRCDEVVVYCRRFIVPMIQALFAEDIAKAKEIASEPERIAAQLTSDTIFSAIKLAAKL